jgi:hypothetical protein
LTNKITCLVVGAYTERISAPRIAASFVTAFGMIHMAALATAVNLRGSVMVGLPPSK